MKLFKIKTAELTKLITYAENVKSSGKGLNYKRKINSHCTYLYMLLRCLNTFQSSLSE